METWFRALAGTLLWEMVAFVTGVLVASMIGFLWHRKSIKELRGRIERLESERPASQSQTVHVHTAERRETVGDTLFDALFGAPARKRLKGRNTADEVREEIEDAARNLTRDDDG